jgi:ABC-type transport system substrate-binding protein
MRYSGKVLILVLIGAVFVISGCGGKDSAKDSNEMVLRTAMYTKITSMDPGAMRDVYSMIVTSQICEPLFQYHFLKRPYELEPLVAEAMPEISDDSLTYTIRIKKGAYFQDDECFPDGKGRELKAEDFVYAIKRIANLKYLSQNWAMFDDHIVGLDEFREYTKDFKSETDVDYSREVEGLKAIDDYTLVIKLTRPWPQMLSTALADISSSPIAKEAVEHYGKDIIAHPVGTGPFMLNSWLRGSFIEMVRNPNFRGELYPSEGAPGDAEKGYLDDAGKMMPFADRVIWRVIEEYQPAWLLFMQGKLDASVIPKDNYNEAMTEGRELTDKMKDLQIELKTGKDPSVFWIGFNMLDEVVGKNRPLRRAISYALDRERSNEIFFNGLWDIAHGVVSPVMDSYDPSIKDKGYAKHDPDKARELLKEAEKVHGGKIPMLTLAIPGTGTFQRQKGQFLQRTLEAVGLEIELDFMDWPTYQEKMNTRSLQLFESGAGASIPDAEDIMRCFYSKYWAPGSNSFNYKNEEFDRLYEKATIMFDSPERKELYRQMELIVLEDCPAAFLSHRVKYILIHDWYKNYKLHAFQYGLSKYRRVDVEKRNAYKELLKKVK